MSFSSLSSHILLFFLLLSSAAACNDTTKSKDNAAPQRIVCLSTSHIAALHALGADSLIVGVSGAQYVSNSLISKRLSEGTVTDIGYGAGMDWEKLIALKPDAVFVYDIAGENAPYIAKMRQFGLNVVKIEDFKVEDPLVRLGTLRTFGRILHREAAADSIINDITLQYDALKEKAASAQKVCVLLNAPYRDVWYVPGTDNYLAKIISDAGGRIAGSREGESRSFPYGLEAAIAFARDAEVWLLQNTDPDLKTVASENRLFEKIPAFASGDVWNNDLHTTPGGGNDFWESGITSPQHILEDLIRILHPEILQDDGPFHYYRKLE